MPRIVRTQLGGTMTGILRTLPLFALLLLAACGVKTAGPTVSERETAAEAEMQRRTVVEIQEAHERQFHRVANRIRRANVPLCGEKLAPSIGLRVANLDLYDADWRDAHAAVRGLDSRLRVTSVFEDGPAHKAGIVEGDVIKSVAGRPVPEGKGALKAFGECMDALDPAAPFELVYERDGVDHKVELAFETVCAPGLMVRNEGVVNAFASDRDVFVTRGMLDFVKSDDELAVVVGHEFAHYAMLHIENSRSRAGVGLMADVLVAVLTGVSSNVFSSVGAGMYSLEQEFEADYVGAYMARRAGYDPSVAVGLWRRMSVSGAAYIDKDSSSHPSNAERGARFKEIVAEIDAKLERGEELLPEMKE
jgi:hypothetical protein